MYAKKNQMIIIMVIAIAFILSIKLYEVNNVNSQMNDQINTYNKELVKSKAELRQTIDKRDYYKSDEYIEKVAREQENLVKKNDIIFVTDN
ncbi:MAG TPA: hypothetical protein DEP72_07225 [Clostridiales bacterium]|nr:MAG: hypothetical protein A2Y18_07170 [Clostridiales bacterium GWD2_32_19]HCC07926.1 hypothetical protein [Clostridiales bacterium]